jgi:hypothetical protein
MQKLINLNNKDTFKANILLAPIYKNLPRIKSGLIIGFSKRSEKHAEFSTSTKRRKFEEVNGVCEKCKKEILGGWRFASYHHFKLVKNGGLGNIENCMVLHFECHYSRKNFLELHGFDYTLSKNKKILKVVQNFISRHGLYISEDFYTLK